jgi:hypothetical protein
MPGLAAVAVPATRTDEFEVVWLDASAIEQRAWLAEAVMVTFEQVPPVRRFSSYRGQRNFPGLWWFATTGEHVGYESRLERDQLMALDADPGVVGVASQPLWLHWTADQEQARRHAPDFFARLEDGTAVLIDVRADDQITPEDAAAFAATKRACALVGWAYRRVGVLDPMLAANLRWLSGYRHPRCLHPKGAAERAAALQRVFARPTALLDGALAVGDPVAVLPVLFHLLWCGRLLVDLTAAPLGPGSLVQAAAAGGRGCGRAGCR